MRFVCMLNFIVFFVGHLLLNPLQNYLSIKMRSVIAWLLIQLLFHQICDGQQNNWLVRQVRYIEVRKFEKVLDN